MRTGREQARTGKGEGANEAKVGELTGAVVVIEQVLRLEVHVEVLEATEAVFIDVRGLVHMTSTKFQD